MRLMDRDKSNVRSAMLEGAAERYSRTTTIPSPFRERAKGAGTSVATGRRTLTPTLSHFMGEGEGGDPPTFSGFVGGRREQRGVS